MIDKSWLRNMLTPSKQKSPMWVDLIDAITDALNTFPEKYLDRLKTRISLFEQSGEELSIELKELGDNFAYGDVNEKNLPLIIMQREDEFHFKSTEYTLASTLVREFSGINIQWKRLFAPKDLETVPYCEKLIIDKQFDIGFQDKDDFFLTSRGLIYIPLQQLRGVGTTEQDIVAFEFHLRRVAHPLVPLHIVLEGYLYYFNVNLDELPETIDFELIGKSEIHIPEVEEQISYEAQPKLDPIIIDEGLRSPAPAEMRDGPVGVDNIALDFEAYMEYVNRVPVSISVTPESYFLISGQTVQLSCEINYEGGFVDSYARWFSGDNDIATVDDNGFVTAEWIKSGDVSITAESVINADFKENALITVLVPDFLLNVGTTGSLAGYSPSLGVANPTSWKYSSNPNDDQGNLYRLLYGSTTSSYGAIFDQDDGNKWLGFESVTIKFRDQSGEEIESRPVFWDFRDKAYRAYGGTYDRDIFNWLEDRDSSEVYVFVNEDLESIGVDFNIVPVRSGTVVGYSTTRGAITPASWQTESGPIGNHISSLFYYENYGISVMFNPSSSAELWKGFDTIKLKFTDEEGNSHVSKMIPHTYTYNGYRVDGQNYDSETFDWLNANTGKLLTLEIQEEIFPEQYDFMLLADAISNSIGYSASIGTILRNSWLDEVGVSSSTIDFFMFYAGTESGSGGLFKATSASNKWLGYDAISFKLVDHETGETHTTKRIPHQGSYGYQLNIEDYMKDTYDWLNSRLGDEVGVKVLESKFPSEYDFTLIPKPYGSSGYGYYEYRQWGAVFPSQWKQDGVNETIYILAFHNESGTISACFTAEDRLHKWLDYDAITIKLTDEETKETHQTITMPFVADKSYRVPIRGAFVDTFNWLQERDGKDIGVNILNSVVPNEFDFILTTQSKSNMSGYSSADQIGQVYSNVWHISNTDFDTTKTLTAMKKGASPWEGSFTFSTDTGSEKWKGYDAISVQYTDIKTGDIIATRLVPFFEGQGYKLSTPDLVGDIYDFLVSRDNKEIGVKIIESPMPSGYDFILIPQYYGGIGYSKVTNRGLCYPEKSWFIDGSTSDEIGLLRIYDNGSNPYIVFACENVDTKWSGSDLVTLKFTDQITGETNETRTIPFIEGEGYALKVEGLTEDSLSWLQERTDKDVGVNVTKVAPPQGYDFTLIPEERNENIAGYDEDAGYGQVYICNWKSLNDVNSKVKCISFNDANITSSGTFYDDTQNEQWLGYDAVKLVFTNLQTLQTHESITMPWDQKQGAYIVSSSGLMVETHDWLTANKRQDIGVKVVQDTSRDRWRIYDNEPQIDSSLVYDGPDV